MKSILIVFATREGHTRMIAGHVAATLRANGADVLVRDAANVYEPFSLGHYAAVIIAGSVHVTRHERELVRFVRLHRDELRAKPTAFISVSLSEAGVEDITRDPEERAKAAREVAQLVDRFLESTGWRPTRIKAVAGALQYTRYYPLLKYVMKRIAVAHGADTDTSKDYVYTDWDELDAFVARFTADVLSTESYAAPTALGLPQASLLTRRMR